ncbi:hypothetical protein [Geobacter sp. DSM 9736]|uniref:hypothetical protein n=1 Tax=Geobacter sp. DSM 9736 TaxID=1277350 RepID=UPI000B506973|nr:hypothetical protein [Geobacter sp. DSM 9736]SNB45864.1 hypothetical protein SAMN06269301_1294 [Geobacter sp. DSM 9736]
MPNLLLFRVLLFFAYACGLAACTSAAEQTVTRAISTYCSAKQAAFEHHDIDPLAQIATEHQLGNLFPTLYSLRTSNTVMRSEVKLKRLGKPTIVSSGNAAKVRTEEWWQFWCEDRKSGRIIKEKRFETYCLEYTLVKNDCGIWKIDEVAHMPKQH